jgi:crotonobetainyl-CoA:carnitine CoA-transferase CaiB-like acyl-CoA transferase
MLQLLTGIRIIDLTSVVLGPYASQILGDLGAEVIKVEPPNGDLFRAVRPGRSPSMGAGFLNSNRNKKSVVIDLKKPEGMDILRTLVESADVLMHNMRPASAQALGISFEEFAKLNPRLVYCYAPGFGEDGPYAGLPAYDDIIQALSGVAYLNQNAEGEPRFLPTILCDKVGGLHLALGVMAGLINRVTTKSGCRIEVPMFESTVSFLMLEQLGGQTFAPPLGSTGYERLQSPYRRPFRTKDGFISVLPYNTAHWTDFLTLIGQHDVANASWVTDPVSRSREIDRLYRIISEVTPERTTDEWLRALRAIDVPSAPVNSMTDVLSDSHLQAIRFFSEYNHPTEGTLKSVRSPFSMDGELRQSDRAPPQLGQDTEDVMRSVGLSAEEIDALKAKGVLAGSDSQIVKGRKISEAR